MLDRMLDRARAGESAVLVMRGEAGIGKTALMHYCVRQASGCRVAQIAGVASELEMPFAALHQLCLPMLGEITALPEPQEQALRVAFGLAVGNTPDRFIVGLAVLGLLAEVAAKRPLVCLVDDAQWLDEASGLVLGFVGRRLLAESVLILLAVRETGEERLFPALPTLTLGGLADEDARALLAAAVPGHLDEQVRDRIVAETRGNPLGLLELPRGMSPAELAGGFGLHTATIPGHIEGHYAQRVTALPEPTRQLMLLAAADPTGDATLLWGAAETLGLARDAAAAAESEQLLEIGARVGFRHPLVRSAVYAAASDEDRRAVHVALAAATDAQEEPERRVWHLAAAATGPDEDLAAQLERTADTVRVRAGLAAAAAFLQRAVALTADPTRRADRALAAAQAHLQAGGFDAARDLVAQAAALAADDLQRARVEQLKGEIEAASRPGRDAPVRLLQAARRLESLDVRLARDTYLQAWWAALLAGRYATPGGDLLAVSTAALSAPRPADPRPCDLLLDGLASMIAVDRAAAAPSLRLAVDLFLADQVSADDWIQWGRSATTAAFALWDIESWAELSNRQVALARASGALASLVISLNFHGVMVTCCGDLEAASALVAEQDAVKEVTGIRIAPYGARLLAAQQGHPVDHPSQMTDIDREFIEHGDDGYALKITSLARAVVYNGLGRYADAFAAAREVAFEVTCLETWALYELIEAGVRSGRVEAAHDALQQLLTVTVSGSDWAAGVEARGRALVSAPEVAERWYAESIARLARTPLRPELARTHLAYGEWLRREGRRVDARGQLGAAYEMFAAMGAEAFAERARRELLATGEKVRKRELHTQHDLTPQEEHIARLARDGRTNAEIGAELFISVRTVEWHLRKVFTKLEITSRKGLNDALPSRGRAQGNFLSRKT
jgi:DNA-binding CsgD family transcriptional regulator